MARRARAKGGDGTGAGSTDSIREHVELTEQAKEYHKENLEYLREASAVERQLLKLMKDKSISAQILENLNRKNSEHYEDATSALKLSSDRLRESVKGMTDTLGLSSNISDTQKNILEIQQQIFSLDKAQYDIESEITDLTSERSFILGQLRTSRREEVELEKQVAEHAKFLVESGEYREDQLSSQLHIQKQIVSDKVRELRMSLESLEYSEQDLQAKLKAQDAIKEQLEISTKNLKRAEAIDVITERLPGHLGATVGQAKGLWKFVKVGGLLAVGFLGLLGVIGLIGLAWKAVVGLFRLAYEEWTALDEAAVEFRKETGLILSQTRDITRLANQLHGEYKTLGITAEDVYASAIAWRDTISSAIPMTDRVGRFLTLWRGNLGVSEKSASEMLSTVMSMSGATEDAALSMASFTANTAISRGVSVSEVFDSISESTESIHTYMRGNVAYMMASAIEARRLGLSLSQVNETAASLLDFESSINAEMEASVLLGRQVDFSHARNLAFQGETLAAQYEVLRVVKEVGDFDEMNAIQKKKLADAAGMTVAELSKSLMIQSKIGDKGDELYDIYDSLSSEMQNQVNWGSKNLSQELTRLQTQNRTITQMEQLKLQWKSILLTYAKPFQKVITVVVSKAQEFLRHIKDAQLGFGDTTEIATWLADKIEKIPVEAIAAKIEDIAYRVQDIVRSVLNMFETIQNSRIGKWMGLGPSEFQAQEESLPQIKDRDKREQIRQQIGEAGSLQREGPGWGRILKSAALPHRGFGIPDLIARTRGRREYDTAKEEHLTKIQESIDTTLAEQQGLSLQEYRLSQDLVRQTQNQGITLEATNDQTRTLIGVQKEYSENAIDNLEELVSLTRQNVRSVEAEAAARTPQVIQNYSFMQPMQFPTGMFGAPKTNELLEKLIVSIEDLAGREVVLNVNAREIARAAYDGSHDQT